MVPPTKLLDLIGSCTTPTDILRQLRESGLLLSDASDEYLLHLIDEGEKEYEALGPDYPFSEPAVHIRNKLSAHLSQKGHQWDEVDPDFWPKPESEAPLPSRGGSASKQGHEGLLQRTWRRLLGK